MSAKETEIWGRPLSKMTTPELKEIAKGIEGVFGVHGMKKEELIYVLRKSKGIAAEAAKKNDGSLRTMKTKIHSMKSKRNIFMEQCARPGGLLRARNNMAKCKKKKK